MPKGDNPWNRGIKGIHLSPKTEFKKGVSPWNKGKPYPQMMGNKNGFIANHIPWNKGGTHSEEARKKMSIAHQGKRRSPATEFKKGQFSKEKNPNWKGGITPSNRLERTLPKYIEWRRQVLKRDDYRCLDCGDRGGRLNADHIYPFADYPRLRFMVENGRTLCVPCHKLTNTYGNRNNHPKRNIKYKPRTITINA